MPYSSKLSIAMRVVPIKIIQYSRSIFSLNDDIFIASRARKATLKTILYNCTTLPMEMQNGCLSGFNYR